MNVELNIDPNNSKNSVDGRFIYVSQGSAAIVETGSPNVGLYTDKLSTCRPYVFVCSDATIMIHDTGHIQLDAISSLISQYGKIRKIHYVDGGHTHKRLHDQRLLSLAQILKFRKNVHQSVPLFTPNFAYSVMFSKSGGLRVHTLESSLLLRDQNHDCREAVNILNDLFIPAKSQSAPLDLQYIEGKFTKPTALKKSLPEMFRDVIVDGNEAPEIGLYEIGALSALIPSDQLPIAFVNFVREHEMERLSVSPIRQPAWFSDPRERAVVMEKYSRLPIFAT